MLFWYSLKFRMPWTCGTYSILWLEAPFLIGLTWQRRKAVENKMWLDHLLTKFMTTLFVEQLLALLGSAKNIDFYDILVDFIMSSIPPHTSPSADIVLIYPQLSFSPTQPPPISAILFPITATIPQCCLTQSFLINEVFFFLSLNRP